MPEDEISALITQFRRLVTLVDQPGPLSEKQRLEFETAEAMMRGLFAHRGPEYAMAKEQSLELATVMIQFRNALEARGVESPPFEEVREFSERLMNAPKPPRN